MKINKIIGFCFLILCLISFSYSSICRGQGSFVKYTSNPVIDRGLSGSWDEGSVGRPAYYFNGTHHFIYYGGAEDPAHRQEESIGLMYGIDLYSLSKHVDNPIIPRADIGYGGSDDGIYPASVFKINDMYYMTLDLVVNDGSDISIGIMNSTNLIDWSNLTLLSGVNTGYDDRGRIKINPLNTSELIITWMKQIGGVYQIYRGVGDISDPYTFSVTDSPLMASSPGVLYPDLIYNLDGTCTLYYSRYNGFGYDVLRTESSDCETFNAGVKVLEPSVGLWDNRYNTGSLVFQNDNKEYIIYQGRSDTINAYIGVGLASRGLLCELSNLKSITSIRINAQDNSINMTINNTTHYYSTTSNVLNWNNIIWGKNK